MIALLLALLLTPSTEAQLASATDELVAHYEARGFVPSSFAVGQDEWGHDIRYYRVPSGGFVLISLGSDGRPGGHDDAADLVVIRFLGARE